MDSSSTNPNESGETAEAETTSGQCAGFEPDDGFMVTGEFVHGGVVTIVRNGGGLGTRERDTPWLWDVVAEQWLAGEAQHAYAGSADGDPIDTSIWTDQSNYEGWDTPAQKFKFTSDPDRRRHARSTAHYGNLASSASDPKPYSKLGFPVWPAIWGAQTNTQMYLSWWQRMDGVEPGFPQDENGNGGEDKPLRFGDSELAGLGEYDITVAGLTATTVGFGNIKAWGGVPDVGAQWFRFEFFVDRVRGIADLWVDGRLQIGSSWTVRPEDGGPFEFRPADEYLFVDPPTPGSELDTAEWINVTVHYLGFDDGGVTQQFAPGRKVELSEIYLDTTRARVEIADAESWADTPDAERTSEVCGRLMSWTDDTIVVELNQGGFTDLAGLHLWIIDDDGAPIHVGRFTP